MSVKMRRLVEREISTAIIDELLKAGFRISVDNGDEQSAPFSSKETILKHMFFTDEDRLYVYKPRQATAFAWAYLVYGNDGPDVLSDYTVNLEKFIGEGSIVDKLSEKYS